MNSKNIAKLFKSNINTNNFLAFKKNNKWEWISRQYLNNMINNSVQILNDHSIQKGDRIAFKGKNSKEWIAWNLATLSKGAIWVPMYPQQDISYSQHVIDDCQPKLLITDEKIDVKNTRIINEKIEILDYDDKDYDLIDNHISTLVYTSGTTGKPKGVTLSHDNILSNLSAIQNRYPDLNNTTSLNILPWAHIYGLTCELYYNLLNDNKMALATSKETFINEVREIKPDVLFVVPKLLELIKNKLSLLNQPIINNLLPLILNYIFGGNIITLFCGGAKLDKSTRDFYLNNGIIISEGYGCSETSPMVSLNHFNNKDARDIESIGKILDKVIVEIINKEVCVAGPNVMQGYWNNPKANQEVFYYKDDNKFYKTGDSGYVKYGYLYLTGRISENYKLSNGKFVNVGELEEKLKKYIKTNFIVYGENMDNNILIVEKPFDVKLDVLNQEIESYLKIVKVIEIEPEIMSKYLTPKMSIKRKALITFLKDTKLIF
jgi:long-chain acyl-CoA synthetase